MKPVVACLREALVGGGVGGGHQVAPLGGTTVRGGAAVGDGGGQLGERGWSPAPSPGGGGRSACLCSYDSPEGSRRRAAGWNPEGSRRSQGRDHRRWRRAHLRARGCLLCEALPFGKRRGTRGCLIPGRGVSCKTRRKRERSNRATRAWLAASTREPTGAREPSSATRTSRAARASPAARAGPSGAREPPARATSPRERAARVGGARGRRNRAAQTDGARGRREMVARAEGTSRRRERAARAGGASERRERAARAGGARGRREQAE